MADKMAQKERRLSPAERFIAKMERLQDIRISARLLLACCNLRWQQRKALRLDLYTP
jgi:hypothetical protein